MGDSPGRSGFPSQMYGLRAPDYGAKKIGRKKYKTNYKKGLKQLMRYGIMSNCDMLLELVSISDPNFLVPGKGSGAKRP